MDVSAELQYVSFDYDGTNLIISNKQERSDDRHQPNCSAKTRETGLTRETSLKLLMVDAYDSATEELLLVDKYEGPSTSDSDCVLYSKCVMSSGYGNRSAVSSKQLDKESQTSFAEQYANPLQELLDLAVVSKDMTSFQLSLNKWLQAVTGAKMVAVLLKLKSECGCICKLDNKFLLDLQDNCHCAGVKEDVLPDGDHVKVFVDIRTLQQDTVDELKLLIKMSGCLEETALDDFDGSVILVSAASGFFASLLVVHQQKDSRQKELDAILPNLGTIGALLSIVDSAEDDKKRVRQMEDSLVIVRDLYENIYNDYWGC
uniref:Ubiquitin-like domain-containing protein n=1 Tax=Syphacia muris TaxID=451379 RepID=A0A158R6A1_9BILA